MSTSNLPSLWQAARIEMPDGSRSWTVLDDSGDVIASLRNWIVHLEQSRASPNTIRAYLRHIVEFANFLNANSANLREVTVALYDGFLAWRLARWKEALPSPKLVQLRKAEHWRQLYTVALALASPKSVPVELPPADD